MKTPAVGFNPFPLSGLIWIHGECLKDFEEDCDWEFKFPKEKKTCVHCGLSIDTLWIKHRTSQMLTIEKGDILESKADALVCPVNCVGVMGKGLALQFARKYPSYYKAYRDSCFEGSFTVGSPIIWNREPKIISFPTKIHWKDNSKLEWIKWGLDYLAQTLPLYTDIKSIAFPRLGCGLGGLDWKEVKPLIEKFASQCPQLEVIIYE